MKSNNENDLSSSVTLAQTVIDKLKRSGLTVATAESCTGGLVSYLITEIPGASEVYLMGGVVYSNEAKIKLLGVKKETLDSKGAVSSEIAVEMAAGVAKWAGTNVGLGITGIAGPGGGSNEKPVGLVFIATWIQGQVNVHQYQFSGDRHTIRIKAANSALDLICQGLSLL